MIRTLVTGALLAALSALSTPVLAQYNPGPGGMGGTSPTYTNKSYGVNKAAVGALIGAGVGGGVLYLVHRHHHALTACTGPTGTTLDDGKNVYTVVGDSLTPNERIVAAGKKVKSDSGTPGFEVASIRKDLGRCEQPTESAQK